jgi:hypothetical protein
MFSNVRLAVLLYALSMAITPMRGADAALEWGPLPSVIAAAQANGIPLKEMDSFVATNTINPGDSLTVLVTLREKGNRRTQWLIYFKAAAPTGEEQARESTNTTVIYNSLGTKLKFVSSPAFVTVRTLGPYAEPGAQKERKANDTTARISLDKGFLALGLDQAAAALMRLRDDSDFKRIFAWGAKPFNETRIEEARKFVDVWKLLPEEERAIGGSQPALLSYLQTVHSTPGLQDILAKLVKLPSAWSLARHGGVSSVAFQWKPDRIELGKKRMYTVPMVLEVNKQPALHLVLIVAKPQPPILSSAGIISLVARRPGDEETILMLQLMSARLAKPHVQ